MVLVKNWQFFHFFILGNISLEHAFHDILEQKKKIYRPFKEQVKKVERLKFLVLVKNCNFFILLFYVKKGRENVFHDILERKNVLLRYKNKKFKKAKNQNFSKGVSPWFWSKSISFSILLFQAKKARKKCFTIFYKEKTSFYALKSSPIDEQRLTHKSTDRNDRQRARFHVVRPCEV